MSPFSKRSYRSQRAWGRSPSCSGQENRAALGSVYRARKQARICGFLPPPPQNPCRRGLRRVVGTIAGERIASEHIGSIYPDLGEGAGGVWSIPIPAGLAFYGSGKASVTSDLGYTAVGAQPRHQLG